MGGTQESKGLSMSKSFVRESFYIQPPAKGASREDWVNWITADEQAATQARRLFNRSRKDRDVDTMPAMSVAKVGGVFKQVSAIGFVGEGEGQSRTEPIAEATQEVEVEQARARLQGLTHRSHGRSNHKSRRQAIREARKAKYRNR